MPRRKYCVKFISPEHKKPALEWIKRNDPKMELDPEGNPRLAWITTSLTIGDIWEVPGVEDAIESREQLEKDRFAMAKNYIMPFGEKSGNKGKTLDAIASSDQGLRWLDWLRGKRDDDGKNEEVDQMLRYYLSDPSIRKELEQLE